MCPLQHYINLDALYKIDFTCLLSFRNILGSYMLSIHVALAENIHEID